MENWNIAYTLTQVADQQPDRTALVTKAIGGYRHWTFRDLAEHCSAYAHGLAARGIGPGDRAVLMVTPSMEFITLTFALFRLGTSVILIDPGMGYRNLLRCIHRVEPTAFIGIPKAQLFRLLNPGHFRSVRQVICVGFNPGFLGDSLAGLADFHRGAYPTLATKQDDQAAIIFTTGSTGPPKGVVYSHGNFQAQLDQIRNYYGITPQDVDQPAFPLFGLFSTALGASAVIPSMNPAHPARVNPARFIQSIIDHRVTFSFGSPAIWRVVSRYCVQKGIVLDSLRLVLMAGAPVPGELIERVRKILPEDALIHTPYGATESLPTTSIDSSEIMEKTWPLSRQGKGTCVGRPLPGIDVKIIEPSDQPIDDWTAVKERPEGSVGEIVVRGAVVTRAYFNNEEETRLAKISDLTDGFWHRMGDLGYLDDRQRLWFCGRKAHRVEAAGGTMYTIPCEAIFNEHPKVRRSALVGIRMPRQKSVVPVLIAEPRGRVNSKRLLAELNDLAQTNSLTRPIHHFLIHPNFPVDIRHNAKIFREKLALWAQEQLAGEDG
ncbi:MAG: AMP-binding protein [Proteobacteria bacterium]|nr:AMP-binding protein [Pseudomonadota bacterium]MBU1686550.1 AMP-binding protein [Pseudomonadota bacterium]